MICGDGTSGWILRGSNRASQLLSVIVERITRKADGVAAHRFSFTCSWCGAWFPGYRPVRATSAVQATAALKNPNVFFFDRVSRGSLVLAESCKRMGALVVFEPSGLGDPNLFREAIKLSHVLKNSNERLQELAEVLDTDGPSLTIETLGGDGLRYRWGGAPGRNCTKWHHLNGYTVDRVADTAGAGDWLTAGLVFPSGGTGHAGFSTARPEQVVDALQFGQAAAAWNCQFEGPRGGMYVTDRDALLSLIPRIVQGGSTHLPSPEVADRRLKRAIQKLARSCKCDSSRVVTVPTKARQSRRPAKTSAA